MKIFQRLNANHKHFHDQLVDTKYEIFDTKYRENDPEQGISFSFPISKTLHRRFPVTRT